LGIVTPFSAIPTINSAIFNGSALGLYVDTSGTPFATTATITANVNFQNRTVGFSTSNTTLINSNTGVPTADSGLNITGMLGYSTANDISGNVNTSNGQLTGTAHGLFYGPAAQEIGGVYQLQNAGAPLNRMIGAFGGSNSRKKPEPEGGRSGQVTGG
jgi:hypothetical protein